MGQMESFTNDVYRKCVQSNKGDYLLRFDHQHSGQRQTSKTRTRAIYMCVCIAVGHIFRAETHELHFDCKHSYVPTLFSYVFSYVKCLHDLNTTCRQDDKLQIYVCIYLWLLL